MLARKSALIVLVNIVGAALGFVALKFVALYVGPVPWGSVGYALAIVGPFEVIADAGFNRAYVKRVSEGRDPARTLGTFLRLKLALVVAMVLVVLAALFTWTVVLRQPFVSTNLSVVLVALAYAALRALTVVPMLTFDARRETARSQVSLLAEHLVRVPALVLVALLIGAAAERGPLTGYADALAQTLAQHADAWIAATYLLGSLATLLVGIWYLRHYPRGQPSTELARDLWRFALPLALVSVVGTLSYQIDRLAIGYFYDPEEVGYYFAAQRATFLLQVIPTAVATLLFPTISQAHSVADWRAVRDVMNRAERFTTFFMAPAIAFFLFLPSPIIDVVLSQQFQPAAPALFLLTVYALLLGLFNLYVSLLAGVDRPGIQARAALIAFVINITLNLVFVPDRGLVVHVPVLGEDVAIRGAAGAALATVVAFAVAVAYLMERAWRVAHKPPSFHVPLQVAVALGLGYLMTRVFGTPVGATMLVLYALAFFLVYVGVLWLIREIRGEDVRAFWEALRPRAVRDYLREELRGPRR